MKAYISLIFVISVVVIIGTNCDAEVLQSNGTAGKNMDAQTLVAYGREFNDSLITMIGRVIENYHVCTAWSEWTECGVTLYDYFATRTRSRRCGGKDAKNGQRDEIETGVCEGRDETNMGNFCPISYHTTTNGFCLKLYMDKKTNSDAEAVCKNDGGYLVNIDSDQKYDDIKAMLIANNVTSHIQIDGRRVNNQWKFSYGLANGYFHWYPGYPRSLPEEICLALTGNRSQAIHQFRSFNFDCKNRYYFACEVLKKIKEHQYSTNHN